MLYHVFSFTLNELDPKINQRRKEKQIFCTIVSFRFFVSVSVLVSQTYVIKTETKYCTEVRFASFGKKHLCALVNQDAMIMFRLCSFMFWPPFAFYHS